MKYVINTVTINFIAYLGSYRIFRLTIISCSLVYHTAASNVCYELAMYACVPIATVCYSMHTHLCAVNKIVEITIVSRNGMYLKL